MAAFYPVLLLSGKKIIFNLNHVFIVFVIKRDYLAIGRTTNVVANDNDMVTNDESN